MRKLSLKWSSGSVWFSSQIFIPSHHSVDPRNPSHVIWGQSRQCPPARTHTLTPAPEFSTPPRPPTAIRARFRRCSTNCAPFFENQCSARWASNAIDRKPYLVSGWVLSKVWIKGCNLKFQPPTYDVAHPPLQKGHILERLLGTFLATNILRTVQTYQ